MIRIREFDLDLNSGIFLYFDETIRHFNLSAFALQKNASSKAIIMLRINIQCFVRCGIHCSLTNKDLNNIRKHYYCVTTVMTAI